MENKCEGACCLDKINLDTQKVRIDSPTNYSWGTYWYCKEAIKIDEDNGFEVIKLDEIEPTTKANVKSE